MSDVFQQTFLGASIVDFNINLGLGSNSSSLSVNLVPDDVNFRGVQNNVSGQDLTHNMYVNGAKEGYSYDSIDSFKLFPVSLWDELNEKYGGGISSYAKLKANLYKNGDYFWAPPQGSAVFFSYFDNKRYYDFQDPKTGDWIDHIQTDNSVARDYLRERWDYSVVNFGGILKSVNKKFDQSSGVTYSVNIEDPRCVLEGTQVILSDHIGLTAPPDNDMFILDSVGTDAGGAGVKRKLDRGYSGSYNVLNVFGYYELRHDTSQSISPTYFPYGYNKLGYSGSNASGLPWMMDLEPSRNPGWQSEVVGMYNYIHMPGIHWALESMTGGWNASYQQTGEPFGGSLFYGAMDSLQYNNNTIAARNVGANSRLPWPHAEHTIKTGQPTTNKKAIHAYRYFLDLTELRKLHSVQNPSYLKSNGEMHWGGTIPNDYYINGQSMSLLSLIQQVCDTAGADFFISLLPGCFASASPSNTVYSGSRFSDVNFPQYSGVIKVNVIQRNRPVKVGIISKAVHDAVENHKGPWASDSTDCRALSKADCARRFPPDHQTQPLEYKAPKDIPDLAKRLRCDWNYEVKTCESIGGVQNAEIGREFTDAVSNITLFGGPRTRVVGVTPIGDRKARKEIFIDQNNSYWSQCWNLNKSLCEANVNCTWDDFYSNCTGFSDQDLPQSSAGQDPFYYEYLPSTELDGVYLNGFPLDDENYRDPAYTVATSEEQTIVNNDAYVSYQWFRHAPQTQGGIEIADRPLSANMINKFIDLDALNSVYSRGSSYACSFDKVTNNLNFGETVTAVQVVAGNKRDCLSSYNSTTKEYDLLGACSKKTCQFNSCQFDGKKYRVPLFRQGTNECTALEFDLKTAVQALGGAYAGWFADASAEDPIIGDTEDVSDSNLLHNFNCETAYPDLYDGVCVETTSGQISSFNDSSSCVAAGKAWVIPSNSPGTAPIVSTDVIVDAQTTQPLCQAKIDAGTADEFAQNNWNVGDGYIDLYPMWGFSDNTTSITNNGRCSDEQFKTEKTCAAAGKDWINPKGLVVTTTSGSGEPIKGLFNDDDPYRDYDYSSGIMAEYSYYNPYDGECINHGIGPNTQTSLSLKQSNRSGQTWITKNNFDLALCFDQGSPEETTWTSYCNKQPSAGGSPLGSDRGYPFASEYTVFKKLHQLGCYQCDDPNVQVRNCGNNSPGATNKIVEIPLFKGGMINNHSVASRDMCENPLLNGTGANGFVVPIYHDTLQQKWDPSAYDPATNNTDGFGKPKFAITQEKVYLNDAVARKNNNLTKGTGCLLRKDPDPAEGIVVEVRNKGFCYTDPFSTDPDSCQRGPNRRAAAPIKDRASIVGQWIDGNFTRPKTATIPIELSNVRGFFGEQKFHTITLSELRAAEHSFDAWKTFQRTRDPAFCCTHELSCCPDYADPSAADVMGAVFDINPVKKGNNTSPQANNHSDATGELKLKQEEKRLMEEGVYQHIRSIALNNYGRTYLMPLPNAPSVVPGCSDDRFFDQSTCEASGHEWGIHGLPEVWVRNLGLGTENRWDIASAGWPGDDDALDFMSQYEFEREQALKKQTRYPQDPNFWTEEGNLKPFVVYPEREYKRLEQTLVDIDFKSNDPETMFSPPTEASLGGKTDGKVFVQASVDPKIYWLPKKSTFELDIRGAEYFGCKDSSGNSLGTFVDKATCVLRGGDWGPRALNSTHHLPYALITINQPVYYSENDSFGVTGTGPSRCINPKRIKISSNHFIKGKQEGVCVDSMPPNIRELGRDIRGTTDPNNNRVFNDKGIHDFYMRYIHTGAACVYADDRATEYGVDSFGNQNTQIVKRRRFLDKYGDFIQDKETCESQPAHDVAVQTSVGLTTVSSAAVWLPEYPCEEIIPQYYPKVRTEYKTINNKSDCEETVLEKEDLVGQSHYFILDPNSISKHKLSEDPYKYYYHDPNVPRATININLAKRSEQTTGANVLSAVVLDKPFENNNNPGGVNNLSVTMAPAKYKPWYGGIPQQCNRFTWGPWGSASNFGKAEVQFDTSLHPGIYGGVSNMNRAAMGKIQGDIAAGAMIASESGSVTISGLPEYKMGSPLQLYNVSGFSTTNTPALGPYITDVSLNIGTNGISTTYRMQTQRKFGNTQEIYEKKMAQNEKERITEAKRRADMEKQMRLPDPRDKKE